MQADQEVSAAPQTLVARRGELFDRVARSYRLQAQRAPEPRATALRGAARDLEDEVRRFKSAAGPGA